MDRPPPPATPPAPPPSSSPAAATRKPPSATVAQIAGFIVALATAALIPLFLWRMADLMESRRAWNMMGLDAGESEMTPLELARTEFATEFGVVQAIPVVLGLLALATAVGLGRRRRWARILGAIWSGVLLLPIAAWAAGSVILVLTVPVQQLEGVFSLGPIDPFALNAIAGVAALIGDLLLFVLLLKRGIRHWAPRRGAVTPTSASPHLAGAATYVPQR